MTGAMPNVDIAENQHRKASVECCCDSKIGRHDCACDSLAPWVPTPGPGGSAATAQPVHGSDATSTTEALPPWADPKECYHADHEYYERQPHH
jgi:hypothetical protein